MRLPNKPSKLIRVAIHDLEEVEKNPRYRVRMYRWHYNSVLEPGVCQVCLAGSVIACRSGIAPNKTLGGHYRLPCQAKMFALDDFRRGYVGSGLSRLGFELPAGMNPHHVIPHYQIKPNDFKTELLKLAADLEKAGL